MATGQQEHVPGNIDRIPDFDTRSGNHLWTIFTVYQWAGPDETQILDHENLLSIMGPGCYYCGSEWTELTAKRRCTGETD